MSNKHFFTKNETVTGSVSVWATPSTTNEIKEGEPAFRYHLNTNSAYLMQENQTCVYTSNKVTIKIPAGIDLLAKTIETLKKKQEEINAANYTRLLDIQKQIDSLLMLTHDKTDIVPLGNDLDDLPF